MRDTFVDLPENRTKNGATGKPVALMIAQRGGGDCKPMHEPVYPQPKTAGYISETFCVA